ncbi:dUTPase [Sulfobacillus harzensis]|uniref:dUTPase n=1 Tax=Sulfobacillus harzensis TaxID=2729629 RepID=A0A7Y0Q185_9FIRM|nr:dUTPase [Sulfobacillus harzensis]NMP21843.1 dUTPase [Sulfobacillus harzensis]
MDNDRLAQIFYWQEQFNQRVRKDRQLTFSPEEWIQKEALALMVELGEVVEEARFKWWKNPDPIDSAKLHEELVDVLHFFISMCIDAGLDAESLYQGYLAKNQENFRRQDGLSNKPGYAAVQKPEV